MTQQTSTSDNAKANDSSEEPTSAPLTVRYVGRKHTLPTGLKTLTIWHDANVFQQVTATQKTATTWEFRTPFGAQWTGEIVEAKVQDKAADILLQAVKESNALTDWFLKKSAA